MPNIHRKSRERAQRPEARHNARRRKECEIRRALEGRVTGPAVQHEAMCTCRLGDREQTRKSHRVILSQLTVQGRTRQAGGTRGTNNSPLTNFSRLRGCILSLRGRLSATVPGISHCDSNSRSQTSTATIAANSTKPFRFKPFQATPSKNEPTILGPPGSRKGSKDTYAFDGAEGNVERPGVANRSGSSSGATSRDLSSSYGQSSEKRSGPDAHETTVSSNKI